MSLHARSTAVFSAALLLVFSAQAQDVSSGRWVDLTHAFNASSVYWPTADMFEKTEVFAGQTDGGFYYSAYTFSAAEHGGTHLDAPIHFAEGANTADQIPLDQMIGPGFVIDVSKSAAEDVDYLISAADIKAFEAENGLIPEGAIVLLNTGRAGLYSDRAAYMGTDERGEEAVAKLHFPGLGADGAALSGRARDRRGRDRHAVDRLRTVNEFCQPCGVDDQQYPGF